MAIMSNSNGQLATYRLAFRVSLACFVAIVTIGSFTCWYARSIGGWEGLGIGLNTIITCGIALAFNFFFVLVAAWKIKESWWLALAHVLLVALIAWWLFG